MSATGARACVFYSAKLDVLILLGNEMTALTNAMGRVRERHKQACDRHDFPQILELSKEMTALLQRFNDVTFESERVRALQGDDVEGSA
ncbi:MAG TPA: hypothetical protein VHU23_01040 [Rhizomicrobium sp.]|jgi:hypothetical protein|nr:hypothetical protein [Rhizomicrobium sp.]